MSEHKTVQKPAWTVSTSTQRILLLVLIVCSAGWIALGLTEFELPLSLVGICIFAGLIGVYIMPMSGHRPGRARRPSHEMRDGLPVKRVDQLTLV
jgi:hypothetical protein